MTRVTNKDLEALCARLRAMTGDETLFIGFAYGSPRLESHGGAFEVSPRLTKGDLYAWMQAYADGIGAREQAARRNARMAKIEAQRA